MELELEVWRMRALSAEKQMGALGQEIDEARAMLAHVAGLLKRHVDNEGLSELTRIELAVAMANAEWAARGQVQRDCRAKIFYLTLFAISV